VPSVRLEALNTGNQIWSASFCTVAIGVDFLWRSLQQYDLLFANKYQLSVFQRLIKVNALRVWNPIALLVFTSMMLKKECLASVLKLMSTVFVYSVPT
jgi:hypothetical protein